MTDTDETRFAKSFRNTEKVENTELLEELTVVDGEVHTTANIDDVIDRIDDERLRERERDGYPLEASAASALATIPFNFYPPEAGGPRGGQPLLTKPLKSVEDIEGQQDDIMADTVIVNELKALSSAHAVFPELQVAYLRAANAWQVETLATDRDGYFTTVTVNPDHPRESVEEIEKYADEEKVVYIIAPADTEKPLGNKRYDPLWEAVEASGLPFVMHGMATSMRNFPGKDLNMDSYFEHRALAQVLGHVRNATSLIGEEVVERFDIDFAFIEHCLSWAPFLMGRLDREFQIRGYEASGLDGKPSDYLAEFYYGTMSMEEHRDPAFLTSMLEQMDLAGQVFYTSDYPHPDSDHVGMIVDHPELTREQKTKILQDTPHELFDV